MNRASRDHSLASRQQWVAKSTPPAHSWNQVRAIALESPLQGVTRWAVISLKPGPCVPTHCPSAGTSVVPLVPLAQSLGAWLAVPSPPRWLLQTISLGYGIQFARCFPRFRGIRFTSIKAADAPVLRAEIAVLLAKDAIEPIPPADIWSGFVSP